MMNAQGHMEPGVLISSPDLRPSLASLLPELDHAGLLKKIVTTVAFDPSTATRRILNGAGSILPKRFSKGLARRQIPGFLSGRVESYPQREILRLLARHFANTALADAVWRWAEMGFDERVAKKYAGRFQCIYGMDHSSLETFRRQKAAGGKCVLRQVMVHPHKTAEVLKKIRFQYPEYQTEQDRLYHRDESHDWAHRKEEYSLADLIIANSEAVRDSFIQAGFPESRIAAIPTGCPPVAAQPANSGQGLRPLIFLFAGLVTARKGLHFLLKAWEALHFGVHAQLWLAGSWQLPKDLQRLPSGCQWLGPLSKSELEQVFRKADVFVFPSLLEGMAHVVLEALSAGLPIITTQASGCGSLVQEEMNGFLIEEADAGSLQTALFACFERRSRLPDMGKFSLQTAKRWTQSDAGKAHAKVIARFLSGSLELNPRGMLKE